jgi:hypothetical protein
LTTDVADTSVEIESAVSTPPSDGALEQSSIEETIPGVQGEETPDTGETEPEAPKSADSYSLQDLNELYREGKLSDPALVQRRESLVQSENDRQLRERETIARAQAEENQRLQQLTSLGTQVRSLLTTAYKTEIDRAAEAGRDPDYELIRERQESILSGYEASTSAVHLEPHRKGVRDALLRINGDTAQNRNRYANLDLPELMVELYGSAYTKGKQTGPSDDHIVMTKAEFEKAKTDHARSELDKSLKARGLGAASSTSSGGTAPSAFSSEAELNRAYNQRAGTANPMTGNDYAREYERLTGKKP